MPDEGRATGIGDCIALTFDGTNNHDKGGE